MSENPRAIKLDDPTEPRPQWTHEWATVWQNEDLIPRTVWVILLDHAPLSAHAHHIGLRLQLHTAGTHHHKAWPSVGKLAKRCGMSPNVVRAALRELADFGWIVTEERVSKGSKREQQTNAYWLSWPTNPNVMIPDHSGRCMERKTNGEICMRAEGWGTGNGSGPCIYHGGSPQDDPLQEMKYPPSGDEGGPPSGDEVPPFSTRGTPLQEMKPSSSMSSPAVITTVQTPSASADAETAFAEELVAAGFSELDVRRQIAEHRRRKESA